jgi:phosphate transport system substrate-binding protein
MKRFFLFVILILSASFIYTGCDKIDFEDLRSSKIEGLTSDNYPKVDGSTSAEPLNAIIFCKLFDIRYKWVTKQKNLQSIEPNLKKQDMEKFRNLIKSSSTHQSYVNLIDKKADFVLNARKMSPDEKEYAEDAGVSLIETPIASDALVFIINSKNPVTSLTSEQIQDIYSGKITNWKEVGGNDRKIQPFVRNPNSGSQELMEEFFDVAEFPVNMFEMMIFDMKGTFDAIHGNVDAICYTVYYYKEYIATGFDAKSVTIDGVYPDKKTIGNKSYPYVAPVYAVIRSDLDKSSMAYKLYQWIQTESGKQTINESGYVSY